MGVLTFIFIFIIGLCWGSFTNVLIDRTQAGKSLRGRSKCDFCGYKLSWLDNVPVLSFVFLKGRCRKCNEKLSWQYPVLELTTGLAFAITFWFFQANQIFQISNSPFSAYLSLFYLFSVVYLLWVILVWDLKYMIIPDFLVLIGIVITALYTFYQTFSENCFFENWSCPLPSALLGSVILSGFFGLMYWFSKGRWIGGGDVKLGFWLGLLVGVKMIYFLILFSYALGALVAVYLLVSSKKGMKSEIPFGPFLVISTYLVIFYQDQILNIWRSLL